MPPDIFGAPPAAARRQRRIDTVVNLGLGLNVLLAAAKTLAGIVGHSRALLADGINSTSDVAYYIVVKIFVRLAGKPADEQHPYGHYQLESIAALIVGAFVVSTAIAIFWDAANAAFDLLAGKSDPPPILAFSLWVALATIALKIGLMLYTRTVSRETHNPAVAALASDHRNDIFSAAGATVGISLGMLGLRWVDPVAGALVALVVLRTGIEILRDSSAELMDAVPGGMLENEVRAIAGAIEGVREVTDIHAHRFGPYLVVNLTVGVDGGLSVGEGDRIATEVERRLDEGMELVRKVYVHFHPSLR
jgi:cation diffusion facilitator family transporter